MADDVVRETEEALELVERAGLGHDLEHDVEALVLVVDLVGEAAPTPAIGGLDLALLGLDLFADAANGRSTAASSTSPSTMTMSS